MPLDMALHESAASTTSPARMCEIKISSCQDAIDATLIDATAHQRPNRVKARVIRARKDAAAYAGRGELKGQAEDRGSRALRKSAIAAVEQEGGRTVKILGRPRRNEGEARG